MSDTMTLFGVEAHKSAIISPCGTYRYELARHWSGRPLVGWVMLNPSTADGTIDDPTVRRCIRFAKTWGFGGIVIRNLFALRATGPGELKRHRDPIGPENDAHLSRCVNEDMTVVAWGARGGDRGRDVLSLLHERGVRPYLLDVTDDGQPRHPLYLKADLVPTPLPDSTASSGARNTAGTTNWTDTSSPQSGDLR